MTKSQKNKIEPKQKNWFGFDNTGYIPNKCYLKNRKYMDIQFVI